MNLALTPTSTLPAQNKTMSRACAGNVNHNSNHVNGRRTGEKKNLRLGQRSCTLLRFSTKITSVPWEHDLPPGEAQKKSRIAGSLDKLKRIVLKFWQRFCLTTCGDKCYVSVTVQIQCSYLTRMTPIRPIRWYVNVKKVIRALRYWSVGTAGKPATWEHQNILDIFECCFFFNACQCNI